jgi:hypothetical protein
MRFPLVYVTRHSIALYVLALSLFCGALPAGAGREQHGSRAGDDGSAAAFLTAL